MSRWLPRTRRAGRPVVTAVTACPGGFNRISMVDERVLVDSPRSGSIWRYSKMMTSAPRSLVTGSPMAKVWPRLSPPYSSASHGSIGRPAKSVHWKFRDSLYPSARNSYACRGGGSRRTGTSSVRLIICRVLIVCCRHSSRFHHNRPHEPE